MATDFLSELSWRGLLHQSTNEQALREHLSSNSRFVYVGFDPTADSLTIGNLIPILLLRHAQRAGHVPVVVMGGGTGLIGDPSGKSSERPLLDIDQMERNIAGQHSIFERLLDMSKGPTQAKIINNLEWLSKISYIDILRDIGKHFSVNAMIQRDSVRDRLTKREQGISYTEFSYMILQAYDFFYLSKHMGVSVQMGGSDQYGNILSGCDLIHRLTPEAPAFGCTAPLLTKADGGKFGKTETGTVWLTEQKTSPYALYQFFLQTDDRDVLSFLKRLTFLPRQDIEELERQHAQNPGEKTAHRTLAREVTDLVYGSSARQQAEAASHALFSGDLSSLSLQTLEDVFSSVPRSEHAVSLLEGVGLSSVEILALTSLVTSKREAREHLSTGAVSFNGKKATLEETCTKEHLLFGKWLAVRKGKKNWHLLRFV